ncbi:MAG: outer membrane beta-barrel protein [Xanthobacteraceae bacterium]|nr:outer membrane beta-barrel protein [Xanthobacteraceae bacterium]
MREISRTTPAVQDESTYKLTCLRHAGLAAVVAAAAVFSGQAEAADLALKAPAAVAYSWSGCYLGANAGLGWASSDFGSSVGAGTHLLAATGDAAAAGLAGTGSANSTGFAGGGQVGCNLQSGAFVYGLEGDVDYFHGASRFSNGTNTLSDGTPFTINQSATTNYIATIRPRIGIAADRNLAYLTGGVAFTSVNYAQTYADGPSGGTIVTPGTGGASASKALVGWAAGAGWEHAFTDHATFRLEYIYASFPSTSALGAIADPAGGANALRGSANLAIQTARLGLNYKF